MRGAVSYLKNVNLDDDKWRNINNPVLPCINITEYWSLIDYAMSYWVKIGVKIKVSESFKRIYLFHEILPIIELITNANCVI
jgi:hypothetical protein